MRVARADGAADRRHRRTSSVDYRSFATAYGADWATRLRLVSLPACALTTPGRRSAPARRCRPATTSPRDGDASVGRLGRR